MFFQPAPQRITVQRSRRLLRLYQPQMTRGDIRRARTRQTAQQGNTVTPLQRGKGVPQQRRMAFAAHMRTNDAKKFQPALFHP